MKKLCIILILFFFMEFIRASFIIESQNQNDIKAEVPKEFCYGFKITKDLNPEILYSVIEDTAKEFKLNIIRANEKIIPITKEDDRYTESHKYVLLANDKTELWEKFGLNEGRYLSEEDTQKNDFFCPPKKQVTKIRLVY